MRQAVRGIGLIALFLGAAFGQGIVTAPSAFDIADVQVSPKTLNPRMSGGVLRGTRFEMKQATMVDLVRVAYSVDADKVLGGPSWVELDRFDVLAKAPANTSAETAKLMLQTLLADRFKLELRPESKPMPAFVLSLGAGKPKLKVADASGEPGCRPQPLTAPPGPGEIPQIHYSCRNVTMDMFVTLVHNYANGYMTKPGINATNLTGSWDFDLTWTGVGNLAAAGSEGIRLFDAIDKQLGMKMEPKDVPMPVIQIVSVNRTPTGNPPGVTTALPPPPPAEFEVAEVRPSAPGATTPPRLGLQASGRLDAQNIPLKTFIALAWNINSDDMIVGLPKFAETEKFDIVAKASTGSPGEAPQLDIDTVRLMLQKLLMDRFKLALHTEDRQVNGYVLTAVKPKLQKADPSERTGCKTPPPGSGDSRDPRLTNPVLNAYYVCQNVTMAQFAEQLSTYANGYLTVPLLDQTGLTDSYDIALSWSAVGVFRGGGVPGQPAGQAPGAAAGGASEPNGAISLMEAASRQLGLKMELQKHPLPVLVVDHLEEKPADN
jgi:uncharacterized protein (TIGR03435 family)